MIQRFEFSKSVIDKDKKARERERERYQVREGDEYIPNQESMSKD